jgi:hypothetical protein
MQLFDVYTAVVFQTDTEVVQRRVDITESRIIW